MTMRYRRFGRTELAMPVITCGGMRYQQSWSDVPPEEIAPENQANLEATIHRAVERGINHIETARGYGSSERQLGWVLPRLPREKLIVQTKIAPMDAAAFAETFETSMSRLQLDYVDLLAFHGVNNDELLDQVLRPGGCLEVAERLRRDGRVRFIGFSTHAPCRTIVAACQSGAFDYVNLHWYWVYPNNWPAVAAAHAQDMGVFIISPVDKGGKLYAPPPKLTDLCAPLSPMAFNDLFCWKRPEVHTLSIGAARPSDFDEHVGALAHYDRIDEVLAPIEARLEEALEATWGRDYLQRWWHGLPEFDTMPGEVNVLEILRLWLWAKALDMTDWGAMRYNLLGHANHWFPGNPAADFDEAALLAALGSYPFAERVPALLREAHAALAGAAVKRQSES